MTRTRKAGLGVEPPKETCEDQNCPFHGTLKVRGKTFTGKVISDKMQRSVTVEWSGFRSIPKYERYKKTKTAVIAHNPPCIDAKEGDIVMIGECRPLSKTKNFTVLKVLGQEEMYALEKAALEEGKHKAKAKEERTKARQAEQEKADKTEKPEEPAPAAEPSEKHEAPEENK